MAALSRGYKPINIITDKLTTLITIALLATLETRQSKLSQTSGTVTGDWAKIDQ